MSVAGSGGRWAGLTEAKRAWARSLGGSGPLEPIAPPDRGPRTADRERKRPRASSPARFSPARPRRGPQARAPPRLCPRGPGCPSLRGGKGPPNKEASPVGPCPCPSASRIDSPPLNVKFPISGPTLVEAMIAGSREAITRSLFRAPLFSGGRTSRPHRILGSVSCFWALTGSIGSSPVQTPFPVSSVGVTSCIFPLRSPH